METSQIQPKDNILDPDGYQNYLLDQSWHDPAAYGLQSLAQRLSVVVGRLLSKTANVNFRVVHYGFEETFDDRMSNPRRRGSQFPDGEYSHEFLGLITDTVNESSIGHSLSPCFIISYQPVSLLPSLSRVGSTGPNIY